MLLVRAKRTHDWILPKGHIEPGETPEETATREVREEAGVEARPIRYLGSLEFDSPRGEHVRAGYFSCSSLQTLFRRNIASFGGVPWLKALELIRFDNARELIRSADSP